MTDSIKMRATGGTVDVVHNGHHFAPDLAGVFSIPADILPEIMRLNLGLEPVPAPAEKLAFNPVFNFCGGLTLANDVSGRLLALELADYGRLNAFGETGFVDSAGQRVKLSAPEARALAIEFRMRLNATI